jgi:hypothetical protein
MKRSRSGPPTPPAANLSRAQIQAAIPLLKARLEELKTLAVESIASSGSDDPRIQALEYAIERTVARIYGPATHEYLHLKDAWKLDLTPVWGMVQLGQNFRRPRVQTSPTALDRQQGIEQGRQRAIALLTKEIALMREQMGGDGGAPAERPGIPASHVISDEAAIGHWFTTQPREVAVTLAARTALRILPLVAVSWPQPEAAAAAMFPVFRAVEAAWVAAKYPTRRNVLASAAEAAAFPSVERPTGVLRAVTLAAAAAAGGATVNSAAFAGRAASAAAGANPAFADVALEEIMAIEGVVSAEARAEFAVRLADEKLWPNGIPRQIAGAWAALQGTLRRAGDDWDVWLDWYNDRLAGAPSRGEDFDIAVAMLADKLWKQGPKAVNPVIRLLIEAHTPLEPIPSQGAGPHFALSPDLKISLAPPLEIDVEGNNLGRINRLLPVVRQAASDLAGHLNPNSQPELVRVLADYRAAIEGEPETIAWSIVFGLGLRLDNAAGAAEREIDDRIHPPLEDAAHEALDSVLTLHGPLILATAEGRELSDDVDRFRLTREQQAALREDAQAVVQSLTNSPDVIETTAAKVADEAAEVMGVGRHPERGTIFGLATVKNAAIVFVPAATLGAVALEIGAAGIGTGIFAGGLQALRESKRFHDAARALGAEFDRLVATVEDQTELIRAQTVARLRLLIPFRNFVTANGGPLRRIALNTVQLRWMLPYIDFIVRASR